MNLIFYFLVLPLKKFRIPFGFTAFGIGSLTYSVLESRRSEKIAAQRQLEILKSQAQTRKEMNESISKNESLQAQNDALKAQNSEVLEKLESSKQKGR